MSKAETLKSLVEYLKADYKYLNLGYFMSPTLEIYLSLNYFNETGYRGSGYVRDTPTSYRTWRYKEFTYQDIADNEEFYEYTVAKLKSFIPPFTAEKDGGKLVITDVRSNEKLICDFVGKKFTKVYVNGRERVIRNPQSFFKHFNGKYMAPILPKDATFVKLVNQITARETQFRNFGRFLIKALDKAHLETYISANVPYDYNMAFPYNYFDKPIRKKLDEVKTIYNTTIANFFGSDRDKGRAIFNLIKDKDAFREYVEVLSRNMNTLTSLTEHYGYDLKTLFQYGEGKNWASGVYDARYGPSRPINGHDTWRHDLLSYLEDYVRMAEAVFGENFEKYPKDLIAAHEEVEKLYNERKVEFDKKSFEDSIDLSFEYEGDDFMIVYPKSPNDIIEEGKALNHCVGSYVQYVIKGHNRIVFLRTKENPSIPLVTIEIKNSEIRQARGKSNSKPLYEANQFIIEYAKKKKLTYNG